MASLLSSEGSNQVHQRRRESIVGLEAVGLELAANLFNALGVEALLDDGGDKGSELGLLPALRIGKLNVDEVETVEWVLLLDTAEQVNAAGLAGVTLDGGARVDAKNQIMLEVATGCLSRAIYVHVQLVTVGSDLDVVTGQNANEGEERTSGLPAFGAAAEVVVSDVALQGDSDLVGGTVAGNVAS